jgi:hypothetical protein
MSAYDIFNGDADGLFALHQLRLHEPLDAVLVTGVKRDITLIERVQASAGDRLTVLDISLHENRRGLMSALRAGASCSYFDHHFPGDIPDHPRLTTHIRYAPDTCTSLIVDDHLKGRFRSWAIAAAFGDNLPAIACRLGSAAGLSTTQLEALEELGQLVNYNAYGATVDELHLPPARLYGRIRPYPDPFEFLAGDDVIDQLRRGYRTDLQHARAIRPALDASRHLVLLLPDAAWARRISGTIANELARQVGTRASAVIVGHDDGYAVSIRAPADQPHGADVLARKFRFGGGRPGAAGINRLTQAELPRFLEEFQRAFPAR